MAKRRRNTTTQRSRVSAEQWRRAFELYLRRDLTREEIAAEVGVSESNLAKRIQLEQWHKRRQQVLDEVRRRELEVLVQELASFELDRIRAFVHLVDTSSARLLDRILKGEHDLTPFDLVAMSKHLSELKVTQEAQSAPQMIFETAESSSESSTKTSTQEPSSDTTSGSARRGPRSPYPASSGTS